MKFKCTYLKDFRSDFSVYSNGKFWSLFYHSNEHRMQKKKQVNPKNSTVEKNRKRNFFNILQLANSFSLECLWGVWKNSTLLWLKVDPNWATKLKLKAFLTNFYGVHACENNFHCTIDTLTRYAWSDVSVMHQNWRRFKLPGMNTD